MKIDSALKEFTEKYNADMMSSIDKMSNELAYEANGYTFPLFNLKESVDSFIQFLEGYGKFHIDNNGKLPVSQEHILEQTEKFISDEKTMFIETAVKYKEIPEFITEYVNSIRKINDATNKVKSNMIIEGIDNKYIGDTNIIVESFTEKLQDKFYPVMEKMLWASGYTSSQRLANAGKSAKTTETRPVFI